MPPRAIGPWVIQSVLGRGGVGTVYRAHHRRTGLDAAVKVLGPAPVVDGNAARRLAREYEVLRGLDHPNVVRVFDAGVADGYSYLAMELVEGLDLRTYLSPALDDPSSFSAACAAHASARGGLEEGEPTADGMLSGSSGEPGPAAIRAL